jgi:hypothetical protein
MIKRLSLFFVFVVIVQQLTYAQKLSQNEVKNFTEECNDLVAYLQFTLNAVGDNDLSPKEKDIIISDSYSKLFRDAHVQIEDDLVPDREAITNKDVQAYLKDVDFFFEKVIFSFKEVLREILSGIHLASYNLADSEKSSGILYFVLLAVSFSKRSMASVWLPP